MTYNCERDYRYRVNLKVDGIIPAENKEQAEKRIKAMFRENHDFDLDESELTIYEQFLEELLGKISDKSEVKIKTVVEDLTKDELLLLWTILRSKTMETPNIPNKPVKEEIQRRFSKDISELL